MEMNSTLKSLSFLTIFSFLILMSCSGEKNKNKTAADATAIYKVETLTTTEFTVSGKGLKKAKNPELTLKRGETYVFKVETFRHPFYIKTKQVIGMDNIYNEGVVKNGLEFGDIIFTVPKTAPDILFYISKFDEVMTGKLIIVD